jgi:hypothetical protein
MNLSLLVCLLIVQKVEVDIEDKDGALSDRMYVFFMKLCIWIGLTQLAQD